MKSRRSRCIVSLSALAIVPAAFLNLAGCASTEGVEEEQVVQSPGQGGAVVDTLTTPDGKSSTFKADKAVDLSQFSVGDQIAVQATEAVAVALAAAGADGNTRGMFVGEATVVGYAESVVIAVSNP